MTNILQETLIIITKATPLITAILQYQLQLAKAQMAIITHLTTKPRVALLTIIRYPLADIVHHQTKLKKLDMVIQKLNLIHLLLYFQKNQ